MTQSNKEYNDSLEKMLEKYGIVPFGEVNEIPNELKSFRDGFATYWYSQYKMLKFDYDNLKRIHDELNNIRDGKTN